MKIYLPWFACFVVLLTAGCSNKTPASEHSLTVAAGCDAAQASCVASGDGLRVQLRMGPDVRILQPFNVAVQVDGDTAVEDVSVDFVMQGMDMGYNHYVLAQHGSKWAASATIPVCVSGRMDWLAEVRLKRGGDIWLARFPFVPARR